MAGMPRLFGIFCFLLWTNLVLAADYDFTAPGWAIEARLPVTPGTDGILTASPQGDIKAQRFFTEQNGQRTFLVRFQYPMAMLPGGETGVYAKNFGDMLKSRPGEVKLRDRFMLGPFEGERLVI